MVRPGRGAVALRRARRLWRDVAVDARHLSAGTLEALRAQHPFGEQRSFCFFVGFPRSGHTLVGSLLDAHPDVLVAHELDVLRFVRPWITREVLFGLLLRSEERLARRGWEWQGYDYRVPGQWQGRVRCLRVVGDKRGRATTERLQRDPALLDRLRAKVGVPVRFVHVVRNPFDNITTMAMRSHGDLGAAARRYFALVEAVAGVRGRLDGADLIDVRHEDLVRSPREVLAGLCRFVGVDPEPAYLDDCASIVFLAPRRTRAHAPWTPALVAEVEARMAPYAFLQGYAYQGD